MQSRRSQVRGLPDPPAPAKEEVRAPTPSVESPAAPQPRADEAERPGLRDARRYAGDVRLPRTMRLSSALYEDLGRLVRGLEDQGYRTDRTELVHAVLHYELPLDADGARKLVGRWRRLIAQ